MTLIASAYGLIEFLIYQFVVNQLNVDRERVGLLAVLNLSGWLSFSTSAAKPKYPLLFCC